MNNFIVSQTLIGFVYLFLQVFFLRDVVLFDVSFCFAYIAFLLLFARETSAIPFLFICFFFGLFVDFFYKTIGVHAAACVLLAYARPYVLNWTAPSGGYETWMQPQVNIMGLQWFVTYTGLLTLIHHFMLFIVEMGSFHLIFFTLVKIIASSFFTVFLLVLFQYIFYPKKGMRG
jgi:hypothetical protein